MKPFLAFFTNALQSITDGRTDRPTDGRTDTRSYRDARTHLKMRLQKIVFPASGRERREWLLKLSEFLYCLYPLPLSGPGILRPSARSSAFKGYYPAQPRDLIRKPGKIILSRDSKKGSQFWSRVVQQTHSNADLHNLVTSSVAWFLENSSCDLW